MWQQVTRLTILAFLSIGSCIILALVKVFIGKVDIFEKGFNKIVTFDVFRLTNDQTVKQLSLLIKRS